MFSDGKTAPHFEDTNSLISSKLQSRHENKKDWEACKKTPTRLVRLLRDAVKNEAANEGYLLSVQSRVN